MGVLAQEPASRSDETGYRRIVEALAETGIQELRAVTVGVHEGRVTLKGSVKTYYAKQLAQETVRRVDGVEALQNEIVVE